jgi:hypothetical protein
VRDKAKGIQTPIYRTAAVVDEAATSSQTARATLTSTSDDVAMGVSAQRIAQTTSHQNPSASADVTKFTKSDQPKRSRRRRRSQVAKGLGALVSGETRIRKQGSSSTLAFGNVLRAKRTRLVLLAVAGVLGIVVLGLVLGKTYSWLSKTSSLPKEQAKNVQPLPSPVKPSPSPLPPSIKPVAPQNPLLTQETAKEVIQTWLSTKAAAFGSTHAVDRLNQILAGPALSQWQGLAQKDKADNLYRQYKHSLNVDSVQTSQSAPNQAQVEATVNEVAQVYEDGQLNQDSSYDQKLRVQYNLVRQDGQWRINDMTVLR